MFSNRKKDRDKDTDATVMYIYYILAFFRVYAQTMMALMLDHLTIEN